MKTITRALDFRELGLTNIGFVPTMGALHQGHLEIVKVARQECKNVVVSIFVNPTQFNDQDDLKNYPRTIDRDLELLNSEGVDVVFVPEASEIYADNFSFRLSENKISNLLCGPFRPGHFDGVLTVVLKLLQIVGPNKAYFGEKDFQQLKLIQEMAKALFLNSQIVGVPTVREPDGLAMSSRNSRLSAIEREIAPLLFKELSCTKTVAAAKSSLEAAGFKVDYVEELWGRRFAAAYLGKVRLIDNVKIS